MILIVSLFKINQFEIQKETWSSYSLSGNDILSRSVQSGRSKRWTRPSVPVKMNGHKSNWTFAFGPGCPLLPVRLIDMLAQVDFYVHICSWLSTFSRIFGSGEWYLLIQQIGCEFWTDWNDWDEFDSTATASVYATAKKYDPYRHHFASNGNWKLWLLVRFQQSFHRLPCWWNWYGLS